MRIFREEQAPPLPIAYKNFYLDKDQDKPVYCLDFIIKNMYNTIEVVNLKIESVDIKHYSFSGFTSTGYDNIIHIKTAFVNTLRRLLLGL